MTHIDKRKQGDIDAQYKLGVMYIDGISLEKDTKKAAHYFELSANQGNIKAREQLELITKEINFSPQSSINFFTASNFYKK
jgi:TPR repeat protein